MCVILVAPVALQTWICHGNHCIASGMFLCTQFIITITNARLNAHLNEVKWETALGQTSQNCNYFWKAWPFSGLKRRHPPFISLKADISGDSLHYCLWKSTITTDRYKQISATCSDPDDVLFRGGHACFRKTRYCSYYVIIFSVLSLLTTADVWGVKSHSWVN